MNKWRSTWNIIFQNITNETEESMKTKYKNLNKKMQTSMDKQTYPQHTHKINQLNKTEQIYMRQIVANNLQTIINKEATQKNNSKNETRITREKVYQ
jgi:hypothetical protein